MPIARFEMPDGKVARFEVAEGTTPEQAQAQIQQLLQAGQLGEGIPAQTAQAPTGPAIAAPGEAPAAPIQAPVAPPVDLAQETLEQRALRLGAQPGIAITPEQQQQIALNQPFQAQQPQLTAEQFQPLLEQEFMDPLARGTEQGLINIGSGILRGVGELRKTVGDKEAESFLADLSASTAIERTKTERAAKESPLAGFVGEVFGESLGFGAGGFGKSIVGRLVSSSLASATGGALSAAGRGEEAPEIAQEAIIGGVFGGATEGVIMAGRGGLDALREQRKLKREAKAIGFETESLGFATLIDEIERGTLVAEKSGIDLLPAQITQDPFQVQATAFLGQNPENSRQALGVLTRQNKQASDAVKRLLNDIALPVDVGTAPIRGRRTAQKVLNAQDVIRAERTSPIYESAFEVAQGQGKRVDTAPVINKIDEIRGKYGEEDEMGRLMDKLTNIVGGPGFLSKTDQTVADVAKRRDRGTLRRMHGIKMGIDKLIQNRLDKGTIDNVMAMDLQTIQKTLLDQMDNLDTGYKTARNEYAALSPAIDDLRDGVIGRIAGLSNSRIKQASSILFDPVEEAIGSDVMRNAIRSLKGVEGGADVARGLLRVELQKRVGKVKSGIEEGGTGAIENVPARLKKAIFGNQSQRDTLFAALEELSPGSVKNAEWLEESLQRASVARPGGSQTAIRLRISERLEATGGAIRDFFKNPINALADLNSEQKLNSKMAALGDALYNPQWAPDMEKIRKLAPTGPTTASRFAGLLTRIVDFNQRFGTVQTAERLGVRELVEGPEGQRQQAQRQPPATQEELKAALGREVERQRARQ